MDKKIPKDLLHTYPNFRGEPRPPWPTTRKPLPESLKRKFPNLERSLMTAWKEPTSIQEIREDFGMTDEEFEARKGPRGEWTLDPLLSVRMCLQRIADLEAEVQALRAYAR